MHKYSYSHHFFFHLSEISAMFYALLTQASEGCDYSIGCGITHRKLDANTWEEAETKARQMVEDFTDDRALAALTILEVQSKREMPVGAWYRDIADQRELGRAAKADRAKRAELQRLAKELGVKLPG